MVEIMVVNMPIENDCLFPSLRYRFLFLVIRTSDILFIMKSSLLLFLIVIFDISEEIYARIWYLLRAVLFE